MGKVISAQPRKYVHNLFMVSSTYSPVQDFYVFATKYYLLLKALTSLFISLREKMKVAQNEK